MTNFDFVDFEQAKLLKGKGFPQHVCLNMYSHDGKDTSQIDSVYKGEYAKPSLYDVQKWLIEAENLIITIEPSKEYYGLEFTYVIRRFNTETNEISLVTANGHGCMWPYAGALAAGINEALKYIELS